jgi:hypothetical protein
MIADEAPRIAEAGRLIPDLLREHPEARRVLERHGLHGCGGRLGPHETLRFFARAHGVDEATLLREIDEAVARPGLGTPGPGAGVGDAIYRPFFLAAIAVVLTAGATWGAWILWNIGLTGSFLEVSIHQVNAHGEAQIYGWVGLFIMGFAYQAFPRMWQTRLAAPRLALVAFGLMVGGIVLRTIGMSGPGVGPGASGLAALGGAFQVASASAFAAQIAATFLRSGQSFEPYVAFVSAALACFVLSCLYSTWHTWNTMTAAGDAALVEAVATYQLPLRDLQVHGLALFMILGVSLRMLPGLFDAPRVGERRAWWAFSLLVAALIGEIALFLAYRWSGDPLPAAFLTLAWLAMAVAIGIVVLPWRPWRPLPESDRCAKFVRSAYLWLAVAMGMLLLMPLYHAAAGVRFSHAYFGAARHAITVGFVSLMIMGMAAKVVPTLNGVDPKSLGSLWGPFLLVNLGCSLRVTLQILTDWAPGAYPLIGLSGTLEVVGLAWWGAGLAAIMLLAPRGCAGEGADLPTRPDRIEGTHRVADVLALFPNAERVFLDHGFLALRNPALRRTLARRVTIEQAARLRGVDAASLLAALNRRALPPSLPLLDSSSLASCRIERGCADVD